MRVIHHERQDYPESLVEQEEHVSAVLAGTSAPVLILTEHTPVYTIGTSGREDDVLSRKIDGEDISVFYTGRGGEVTYHGPGQLVCYVIVDIRHDQDLHKHVWRLEEMVIRSLDDFGIVAGRNKLGIGVWVDGRKIAAVGVRCRRWVTFHGIALNIDPNLRHFSGIVPCGMHDAPVTSMHELGVVAGRLDVEQAVTKHAMELFSSSEHETDDEATG